MIPFFKLLVVDVDGTLIGSSGSPSVAVADAIHQLSARGTRVALCSGRPLASCWPIARNLDLRGPHVVFNGALVACLDQEQTPILAEPLPRDALRRVVDYCRSEELCLELYTAETHFVEHDWRESRLHAISIRVTYDVANFDQLMLDRQIIKGQIITSDARTRASARILATQLRDQVSISVAIPMAPCVDMECLNVVDRNVGKGKALQALLEHEGLSRTDVAAAGDAPNDLPVFLEAGFRIAMGNADEEVRAAADVVCAGVDEDGLARAIEQYLL